MRRGAPVAILLVACALAAPACAARRTREAAQNLPPVTLRVENQNFNDVTIYLLWGSDRRRLGIVGGNSRSIFSTRWVAPELQLELDVLAGSRVRGDRINVNPGDSLIVEIPSVVQRFRIYKR